MEITWKREAITPGYIEALRDDGRVMLSDRSRRHKGRRFLKVQRDATGAYYVRVAGGYRRRLVACDVTTITSGAGTTVLHAFVCEGDE